MQRKFITGCLLSATLILGACATGGQRLPDTEIGPGGQKTVTEYYPSGKVKTIRRYAPEGGLFSVINHDEKGIPVNGEQYNDRFSLDKVTFWPNGKIKLKDSFDKKGRLYGKVSYSEEGKVLTRQKYDESGNVLP